ncbi:hypothetical protein [Actinoplanes sp. NPDC049599]|uniref:hypothetical protein n=1 Tax=Actinoplanes sp. NPDC049599 TaxID=3363903 RepID=UPI0037907D60
MRRGPRDFPSETRRWFAPPEQSPPRQLAARWAPSRITGWADARFDEIAGALRGVLWRFVEGVAGTLYPSLGPAVAAAGRVAKWGPVLLGLNDGRAADVKIGLIGSEHLGLWTVLRTRLGQSDFGPRPGWCVDLPVGPNGGFGAEGIRDSARIISGIETVKPTDVAPLLLAVPHPGATTRLLARVDVRRRSGVVAVDAGDGYWLRRLFFTVASPAHCGAGHHETFRVVCPVCGRRRLAQFRGFDVCSDCGWLHTSSGQDRL